MTLNDSPATPSISFVVCTRNRSAAVTDCVRTLLQSPRQDIEVIVRDNNSVDDTVSALRKINDPRLRLLEAPENQGTLNFFFASQAATGNIVTWLSDEDTFKFEHLDFILDTFARNPECDVLMGSIIVGRQCSVVQFEEAIVENEIQAYLDTVLFSGCGGIFIRRSALFSNVHQYFKVQSLEDAYVLWNYYPMGFFASRCVSNKLAKTSRKVVEQTRFAQTTNNWSKNAGGAFAQRPHYYPESVFDRLTSNIVNIWLKPVPLIVKFRIVWKLVRGFYAQTLNFNDPTLYSLLQDNYPEETVKAYREHIAAQRLDTAFERRVWGLRKIIFSLSLKLLYTYKNSQKLARN
jgi:glycosyltransferase involved in cell wall biosynthesis